MLDVDFAVCTNFRRSILESTVIINKLRDGASAFVIPAFEYVKVKDGMDHAKFPRDKKACWIP
jgi:glycosyltransferase-like protein LARGE